MMAVMHYYHMTSMKMNNMWKENNNDGSGGNSMYGNDESGSMASYESSDWQYGSNQGMTMRTGGSIWRIQS
jgi:hypothetical protein